MQGKINSGRRRRSLAGCLVALLLFAGTAQAQEESVFAAQARVDQNIAAEMAAGAYTLEDPLVVVDPYGRSPLSALVIFATQSPTRVEVAVEGRGEHTGMAYAYDMLATEHAVPVYGLYPGTENSVRVTAVDASGARQEKALQIRTEPLPGDFSSVEVVASQPERMAPGLTFFDCPHLNGNYPLAIDADGDVRWYLSDKTLNGSVMMTYLENGNLIVSSGKVIPDTYNNLYSVYEITPLGRFVREYAVYGAHHDVRQKANGNLLIAASMEGRASQNDYIVEIDWQTGEVVDEWDLFEILPMDEHDTQPPYSGNLSNWLHNNGFWYDEETDTMIISGRHQNLIAKIAGGEEKTLVWAFSETIGERNESMRPYLLTPEGEAFEYPTSQHAPMLLPDGRLMLFDNRNQMPIPAEGEALDQSMLYSRAVIYAIDEQAGTIRQDWAYGQDRLALYSSFGSDVDDLGDNHYLIDFGGRYTTEDGGNYDHILTPAQIKNASARSSVVVELLEDEVIFEAVLYGNDNSNSYKAQRHDIYTGAEEWRP